MTSAKTIGAGRSSSVGRRGGIRREEIDVGRDDLLLLLLASVERQHGCAFGNAYTRQEDVLAAGLTPSECLRSHAAPAESFRCTDTQQQFNRAHNAVRAIGERGSSLLKTTFKALRAVSLCPWSIGRITAAALVILHIDHNRTT